MVTKHFAWSANPPSNPIDLTGEDDVDATTSKFATVSLDQGEDEDDGTDHEEGFYIIEDDDDDEDDSDDQPFIISERVISDPQYARRSATPAFLSSDQRLNSARTELGFKVRPGDGFDVAEVFEGGFFRILQIMKHGVTGEITVRGIRFYRTRSCKGFLPKNCNEVYVMMRAPADVEDPSIDSYLECLPLQALELPRRIILSNIPFGGNTRFDHSFRHNSDYLVKYDGLEKEDRYNRICDDEQVVARWACIEYTNAAGKLMNKGKIRQLTEDEADGVAKMSDVQKTFMFRGEEATRVPGNHRAPKTRPSKQSNSKGKAPIINIDDSDEEDFESVKKRKRSFDDDDLSDTAASSVSRERKRVLSVTKSKRERGGSATLYQRTEQTVITNLFTTFIKPGIATPAMPASGDRAIISRHPYGELCVGAGGVLQEAVRIFGEHNVRYVLDHWDLAVATVKRNWPNLNALLDDINGFCTNKKYRLFAIVAVLHISFPCQNDSPANTRQENAKNFDANEATKYSVIPILQLAKPRVVTMEQTSGMISHHPRNFRAMVHQFTSMNYSVSWEVILADSQGGVQKRKRLIMYASCPGEPLPDMPKPTHGDGPGLKPYTTVNDCLRRVPANVEPHMRQASQFIGTRKGVERHQPLTAAITCNGGKNDVHPNGTRGHEMIELAMYQDFRPNHKFVNTGLTNLKKLIGNAVPRCLAGAWFEQVEKSLNRRDKVIARWKPEVIELD